MFKEEEEGWCNGSRMNRRRIQEEIRDVVSNENMTEIMKGILTFALEWRVVTRWFEKRSNMI